MILFLVMIFQVSENKNAKEQNKKVCWSLGIKETSHIGDWKTGKLFKKTNEHKHLINDVPCPSCL